MAKSEKKPTRSGATLGVTYVDEDIRAAMDAYILAHNSQDEHQATNRSTVEAALKQYLRAKGFWPWPRSEEKAT